MVTHDMVNSFLIPQLIQYWCTKCCHSRIRW